jgi:hypothetical protein
MSPLVSDLTLLLKNPNPQKGVWNYISIAKMQNGFYGLFYVCQVYLKAFYHFKKAFFRGMAL